MADASARPAVRAGHRRTPSVPITSAPARCRTKVANAASKSRSLLACRTWSSSPSVRAAACVSLRQTLGIGIGRVDEQRNDGGRGDQLVQQLQPLRRQLRVQQAHAGEIAARPVQAGDKAELDRIEAHDEHDRNGRGRRLGRQRRRCRSRRSRSLDGEPDRPQVPAVDRIGPPPSDIRSPRCGPRHNRLRSGRCGTRPNDAHADQARQCRGTRSPASPAAARSPRAAMLPQRREGR